MSETETLTVDEFARQCRDICGRNAQGWKNVLCGETLPSEDGETTYGFCGGHMAQVIGNRP